MDSLTSLSPLLPEWLLMDGLPCSVGLIPITQLTTPPPPKKNALDDSDKVLFFYSYYRVSYNSCTVFSVNVIEATRPKKK